MDDVVAHKFGEKSSERLTSTGFQSTTFKSYPRYVMFGCYALDFRMLSLTIALTVCTALVTTLYLKKWMKFVGG